MTPGLLPDNTTKTHRSVSVRESLLRSTSLAVVLSLLIVTVPAITFTIITTQFLNDTQDTPGYPTPHTITITITTLALFLIATAAAAVYAVVRWQAGKVSDPLVELANDAKRLGEGNPRIHQTASGITEIDLVTSELDRSARRLITSLAAERDFSADASHQLRTPLTALLMRLEEIAATDDLDVAHEEAGIAIQQVERLTDTVEALLRKNRRSVETPRMVRVDRTLAELQRLWQPKFERESRAIHVTGIRGVSVWATSVNLTQILGVIIENSLAHGSGTTVVDVRLSGPSVIITITDEGPGVDPDLAPYVFDKEVSTSGSGLGLSIARSLAEGYGGRLELLRTKPATFALFLQAVATD
ncbi:Signal transduction histidine-protein kinase ArlS [Dermatophilus congolensis]|uniref:histidine kinase n=1 Tax=Dermatophilus congolensis TaxID=1863 RepID=A0AA46GZH5_9MICO|nr:HAMP domain-containing sensor histidine kinase [Dermatophilus congolensis]STD03580.1 Signal transduction histidine-protein kinase ArlS [Dermatophilus congolensis]